MKQITINKSTVDVTDVKFERGILVERSDGR